MTDTNSDTKLSWLLDGFVADVHDVHHAVVLSNDGLVIARSTDLGRDTSDKLAAAASSLRSIAKGVSRDFQLGTVQQNHVEMESGMLFVSAAGHGAALTVLTSAQPDVEEVAYQMGRLITQVGSSLSAAPRDAAGMPTEKV